MKNLTITDVRAVPGDSGFLIDDGETAVLYDTGFACTGEAMAQKIQNALDGRPLDYILLTHSHYDHALGSAYIRQAYPSVKVAAGEYACKIFEKPTARAVMRELDQKAASGYGITGYEDRIDELSVDIPLKDGDVLRCGGMHFTAIALPGHTRCSMGFYLQEHKLLLGTETLGVCFGNGICLPSYLVGYEMTMRSIQRAKETDWDAILAPHYGLLEHEDAEAYLTRSEAAAKEMAETILTLLKAGKTHEEILAQIQCAVYTPQVQETYPVNAFQMNTRIMIDLIEKEWG